MNPVAAVESLFAAKIRIGLLVGAGLLVYALAAWALGAAKPAELRAALARPQSE